MDFDDQDHPSETEESQPKVFKLLSETDIQVEYLWGRILLLYQCISGDGTEILR